MRSQEDYKTSHVSPQDRTIGHPPKVRVPIIGIIIIIIGIITHHKKGEGGVKGCSQARGAACNKKMTNVSIIYVVIWKYEQLKKPSDHFFEKIIKKKVVLRFLQLLILPNDYNKRSGVLQIRLEL